jgi:hypothetical protein
MILFRPAQLRNAIGMVILIFPFSSTSTFLAQMFLSQHSPTLMQMKIKLRLEEFFNLYQNRSCADGKPLYLQLRNLYKHLVKLVP